MTALTEPQRAAIRDAVAGLDRREIVFLMTTECAERASIGFQWAWQFFGREQPAESED